MTKLVWARRLLLPAFSEPSSRLCKQTVGVSNDPLLGIACLVPGRLVNIGSLLCSRHPSPVSCRMPHKHLTRKYRLRRFNLG